MVETAFASADFLDFGNQMVEVVFVKDLAVDESVLIQYIALLGEGVYDFGGPLAELGGSAGVDAVSHGDDDRQGVEFIAVCFSIVRNLCKICTSCIFG